MRSTQLHVTAAVGSLLLLLVGCGGDADDPDAAPSQSTVDVTLSVPPEEGSETSPAPDAAATTNPPDAEPAGQACALLDDAFLNATFGDRVGTFGEPFEFGAGLASPDGLTCTWNDASTGLSLRITLESAATAQTDDHSGRAYNIDVEPLVEPQDGPGDKAVLLVDPAFGDLGGDGFPYGYFFVRDDLSVFVETVGLDIGADGLRLLADEAFTRLEAG